MRFPYACENIPQFLVRYFCPFSWREYTVLDQMDLLLQVLTAHKEFPKLAALPSSAQCYTQVSLLPCMQPLHCDMWYNQILL